MLWKPPGGKALGFHQDSSYEQWAVPSEWVSCWIALEDTTAAQGTVDTCGGHIAGAPLGNDRAVPRTGRSTCRTPPGGGRAPGNPTSSQSRYQRAGGLPRRLDWHGSDVNRSELPRRSLVAHCMSSEARFHPETTGYLYSRYKRFGDDVMDESFFPIIWREDGYRSPFLDPYLRREVGWAGGRTVESNA